MLHHLLKAHFFKFTLCSSETELPIFLAVAAVLWILSVACIHLVGHQACGAGIFHAQIVAQANSPMLNISAAKATQHLSWTVWTMRPHW